MNECTPEKVAELVERLREVIDTATSDSFTVENDRCVRQAEYDAISAERDEAEVVRDEIIAALTAVSAERDLAKSGAKTLGEIVDRQVEDILRWAGMEDQIGMDDPDQQLAWELCAEMPGKIVTLQADRDRLHKAITEALAFESVLPAIATEPRRILRAALDKEGNDDE